MDIPAKPLRAARGRRVRIVARTGSTLVGPVLTVNEQPAANRGWSKVIRRCRSCNGSGTQPAEVNLYRIAICTGCNGRGYVKEWRKEQ
jgi:hypothetical protein